MLGGVAFAAAITTDLAKTRYDIEPFGREGWELIGAFQPLMMITLCAAAHVVRNGRYGYGGSVESALTRRERRGLYADIASPRAAPADREVILRAVALQRSRESGLSGGWLL